MEKHDKFRGGITAGCTPTGGGPKSTKASMKDGPYKPAKGEYKKGKK